MNDMARHYTDRAGKLTVVTHWASGTIRTWDDTMTERDLLLALSNGAIVRITMALGDGDQQEVLSYYDGKRVIQTRTLARMLEALRAAEAPETWESDWFSVNDEREWAGFSIRERTWNGFATPAFSRAIGFLMLSEMEDRGEIASWEFSATLDRFTVWQNDSGFDASETYPGQTILDSNGKTRHVYPIGSHCWTWSRCALSAADPS